MSLTKVSYSMIAGAVVNVLDYGAVGDGVTDNTVAIQAALSTGRSVYLPKGIYCIKDALNFTTPGQKVFGDGKYESTFSIKADFNLAASGVFVLSGGEPGSQLQDFGITFAQPDTTIRASLTAYPVAIYAVACPRFVIKDLRIFGAINGINMTGNSGGAYIDLLELSAFGTGIAIDGALDTIRINKLHFWPFGLTVNQTSIFFSVGTTALTVGRVDGLFLHEFLNISNLGLYMQISGLGTPQVYISNSGFDSYNGIFQDAGLLEVSNSYISVVQTAGLIGFRQGGSASQAFFNNVNFFGGGSNSSIITVRSAAGCILNINNCTFDVGATNVYFITYSTSAVSNCQLALTNSYFNLSNYGGFVAAVAAGTPSDTTKNLYSISNNYFNTLSNTAYANPVVKIATGNRITLTNNRANDKGTGASTFISIAADDYNFVTGNIAPGWTNTFPVAVTGYYLNNLA